MYNMITNKTLPLSEARKKIFNLTREIQKPGVYYILTHRGQPKAVLISIEEFESWVETLEVMKEFPEIEKDIKKAEEEYKKGEYTTLEKLLGEYGYMVREKKNKKYDLSDNYPKKNSKRNR